MPSLRAAFAASLLALAACSSGEKTSSSTSTGGTGGSGGAPATSSSTSASTGTGGSTGTGSVVTVSGYQLIVQQRNPDGTLAAGVPWDMKGIAWSPFGANEPFDGSGAIYATHAAQDIPLMKAAHINTVRTYGPFEASGAGLAVLDALHAQNMMVAMTVFAAFDDAKYVDAVTAFKDHPAVLLWVVGNEWNYNKLYSNHTFDECVQKVNEVAAAIKALDANHPVATVYGELPSAADYAKITSVDVWGLNLYPYLDFGNRFTNWKALSPKPFFVSEYGADAFNDKSQSEDQASQAHALESLTNDLRAHLSAKDTGNPCIGGCPYEWNDEWWKSGAPATHDTGGFANQGVYPDGFANEEWWGIVTAQRATRSAYTTLQMLYQ
jgi:exo-beta-1,3-glucanase (GH17 family)